MMKITALLFLYLALYVQLTAKEGMWIPLLLEKYNIEEMQQMGFKLTPQDIYDVNNSSMKDAVVIFGGGCTGELISREGLIITNHHCGYSKIQSHSSLEKDYLTNGFWAMSRDEELPNPGLTVRFLEYMEDVTDKVLNGTDELTGEEQPKRISRNISALQKEASEGGKFSAQVKPLFYGNQFFLYVYKTYRDVRLVGAPPSSIGKFGGDTDNWMWPRHTGDFSLFRVYAGADNEPADYSPENVPYTPKKFFPVSMKGVKEGDFTMVIGNPGTTTQYWPSQMVEITMNQRDPDRVKIRDKRLEIIGADMEADPKVRIQYAAKHAGASNSWKRWKGEIKGLERLDAVTKKREFEGEFMQWALATGKWEEQYKAVFEQFEVLYPQYRKYVRASDYYGEIFSRGVEIFTLAGRADRLINYLENKQIDRVDQYRKSFIRSLPDFHKNFNQSTDEKLFVALLPMLVNDLDNEFIPEDVQLLVQKFDEKKLLKKIYRKSILVDRDKLEEVLEKADHKKILKLRNDPLVLLYNQLKLKNEMDIQPQLSAIYQLINFQMKKYVAGIMEMYQDEALYPDANLSLRVSYGRVKGYQPRDGVTYKHYTTLSGIMDKDNTEIYHFRVPEKLKELYLKKEFGRYEVDGDVPVCFTASNHTTGGNSGSPVVNGNGELIGVNFDRVWEGTMSDILFDPERCRNISIDIRYALFIIDKFAGAGYLLDEMDIVF